MADRQIELTWVCPSCSTRNLGRYTSCTSCSAPKPADVAYEMPANTAAVASVTDPELLRLATAGPNWRCSFCGSDQRKLDGACAQCGAPSDLSPQQLDGEIPAGSGGNAQDLLGPMRWLMWPRIGILVGALFAVLAVAIGWAWWSGRPHDYQAKVAAVHWTQRITVEKYKVWERKGWRDELRAGAFDVVSEGQQVHHYEDVLDGYDTQTFTDTVSCGQDCTETAPICHEECTNSGNGFASCHQECTGGGQSCQPKFCTKTRTEQVPRYHKEPRYAEAVHYKIWDWGDDRTVVATGSRVDDLRWPVEEAHVGEHLGEREQERARRDADYQVTIAYGKDEHVTFPCPRSMLSQFAPGTPHALEIRRDTVLVDHLRVEPVAAAAP